MTQTFNIARRDIARSVALGLGLSYLVGIRVCAGSNGATRFADMLNPGEVEVLSAVIDTLIPRTDTPGAIDVGVLPFVQFMFDRSMEPSEQKAFRDGLQALMRDSQTLHAAGLAGAAAPQREAYLEALEASEVPLNPPGALARGNPAREFLTVVKRLTVIGFFTSEIAARHELDVELFPGSFVGEKPMNAQSRTFYEDAFGVPLERPPGYLALHE